MFEESSLLINELKLIFTVVFNGTDIFQLTHFTARVLVFPTFVIKYSIAMTILEHISCTCAGIPLELGVGLLDSRACRHLLYRLNCTDLYSVLTPHWPPPDQHLILTQ